MSSRHPAMGRNSNDNNNNAVADNNSNDNPVAGSANDSEPITEHSYCIVVALLSSTRLVYGSGELFTTAL